MFLSSHAYTYTHNNATSPSTTKDYQVLPSTTKYYQVLPRTTKDYQVLPSRCCDQTSTAPLLPFLSGCVLTTSPGSSSILPGLPERFPATPSSLNRRLHFIIASWHWSHPIQQPLILLAHETERWRHLAWSRPPPVPWSRDVFLSTDLDPFHTSKLFLLHPLLFCLGGYLLFVVNSCKSKYINSLMFASTWCDTSFYFSTLCTFYWQRKVASAKGVNVFHLLINSVFLSSIFSVFYIGVTYLPPTPPTLRIEAGHVICYCSSFL